MLKDVMRNVVAFVDGVHYAGQCSQVTLPELKIKTEEMRGGGMDAPIEMDMGMEALRATLQFLSVPTDVMALLGKPDIPLTIRGGLISHDGSVKGATAQLRGKFVEQIPGNWQAGSNASFSAVFAASYYKLTVEGREVYEIDIERMVRRINGVDQLATLRSRLGI